MIICFFTKSLTKIRYFILSSSKAVRTAVSANLLILDISPLISFILTLKEALEAKLVILDISFLISFTLALRVVLVTSYKLVISSILFSIFLIVGLYRSL